MRIPIALDGCLSVENHQIVSRRKYYEKNLKIITQHWTRPFIVRLMFYIINHVTSLYNIKYARLYMNLPEVFIALLFREKFHKVDELDEMNWENTMREYIQLLSNGLVYSRIQWRLEDPWLLYLGLLICIVFNIIIKLIVHWTFLSPFWYQTKRLSQNLENFR